MSAPPGGPLSGPLSGPLARIAAVARATLRDLFAGRVLLLALLLAASWWWASRAPQVASDAEAAALRLERRLTWIAVVAGAAALLAGAHALGEERRIGQLEAWRATPLRSGELLIGRTVGVVAGVACGALPLLLWQLVVAPDSLRAQAERFAPRESQAPLRVVRQLADGSRIEWRRGALLLDPGESVQLEFAARAAPAELLLPWSVASRAGGSAPADFTLRWGAVTRRPVAGETVATWSMAIAEPTPEVEIVVAQSSGVLRLELDEVRWRGPPGSWLPSGARLAAGVVVEVVLAAALGVGLAALVGEGLAVAGGALLLLLAHLRGLFLAVATVVDEAHTHAHSHVTVDEGSRALAHLFERLVVLLPDLARVRAVERVVAAEPAWRADDGACFAAAAAFAAGVLLLARLQLARRPKGAA
ncbi:MAG: hypothetical protein JNL90_17620 [Planctomycetes bacterium]|nr:hypothetical protein [Planctomycetota bacterium]